MVDIVNSCNIMILNKILVFNILQKLVRVGNRLYNLVKKN